MKSKTYHIYCVTKANRHHYLHHLTVSAESVKAAKEKVSKHIQNTLGRHAFLLSTSLPKGYRWETVSRLRSTSIEDIQLKSTDVAGWQIR